MASSRRKGEKVTKLVILFVFLLAIVWAFFKVGAPFKKVYTEGVSVTDNLRNEILNWDVSKKTNYNAKFEISLEVKDFNVLMNSLSFLDEYTEKYHGAALSKYEYIVRLPKGKHKDFLTSMKELGEITQYRNDYSTALNSVSLQSYNDSLLTLESERKHLLRLRRENPNIKGYDKDINEIDAKVGHINKMKLSLSNEEYNLYLVVISEVIDNFSLATYTKNWLKYFGIGLVGLGILIPLFMLGGRLFLYALSLTKGSSNHYNNGYYKNYGYDYGKDRKIKRVYKDKKDSSTE